MDHAGEVELMKNEQLISLRDMTREMLRNLSDLRSEITSTRRAQIDMRRSMQQEVNTIQTSIIQQLEEYDQGTRVSTFLSFYELSSSTINTPVKGRFFCLQNVS